MIRGFRAPNVFDLGTLGPRLGDRFNIPSRDLDAEVIYAVDLGLKILRPRFRGEIFGCVSPEAFEIASNRGL